MSALRNIRLMAAACIAGALLFVPVGISPAGMLEIDGACASSDCRRSFYMMCTNPDTGEFLFDYKTVWN